MDIDLDLSWIKEEESLLKNVQTQHTQSLMSSIAVRVIYTNLHREIIDCKKHVFLLRMEETRSVLDQAVLLQHIQSFKCDGKYKLDDMFLYNVDVDFEHLQSFSRSELKRLRAVEDVLISPSLPIFHQLNEVMFFFSEVPPSILKKPGSALTAKKKVRISEEKKRVKQTRKKEV